MSSRSNKKYISELIVFIIAIVIAAVVGISNTNTITNESNVVNEVANSTNENTIVNYNLENIPEYTGKIEIDINNNVPFFADDDMKTEAFEMYSNLDSLGRAGIAYANICKDIMPQENEKRGQLSYKPSGWKQVMYDNGSKHLYERCHLIAWSLGNENDNKRNLITGTRDMNTAMIKYENSISSWIKDSNNSGKNYHVLYRVTPYYNGNNLVATGVELEAKSVEDKGEKIKFNKFIYNVQEGFEIDYATGEAKQK